MLEIAQEALVALEPANWIDRFELPSPGTAVICWGKAALATARALEQACLKKRGNGVKIPTLVITPRPLQEKKQPFLRENQVVWGEHPLPGAGSLIAGTRLLEFFDTLRSEKIRRLEVYLSGGASSLAWLPFPGMSAAELHERLGDLYARPFSIEKLNKERARLDQLKNGGSARWLKSLAPEVRARVWAVSDVLPFGPRVVGSGPFWDGKIRHRVVADNHTWVEGIARDASEQGLRVRHTEAGLLGGWAEWVSLVEAGLRSARFKQGLMIFGGEPQVDLRGTHVGDRPFGRGGRQTQIAAELLLRRAKEIAEGRIEILCLSSDGVDGRSGAAGAWLGVECGRRALRDPRRLAEAIARFDSAAVLGRWGALVPSSETGTNVQDVVIVRT